MGSNPIVLFELDIAVPAQQFRIEYTLVDKGGLPVVPEFLLRLLKISALLPAEIARYFGFSIKELSVAITPFLQSGEIRIRPDGRAELTEIGLRLFSESHETPIVKRKEERQQTFSFDLLAFSYLGRSLKSVESKRTLELQAPVETLTESCKLAVSAFMGQIYEIHRAGDLGGQQQDRLPPELYKVADAKKTREGWEIVEERAAIDPDARQVRFIAKDGLRENEDYLRQRTEQLNRQITTENLEQVLALTDYFGDSASYDFLKSSELDLSRLHSVAKSTNISDPRLFGSLQLQENWDKVSSLLRKHLKELQRAPQDEPLKLTWIAPASHGLWGKTARHGEICSAFAEFANTKVRKDKGGRVVFDVKILIPLSDERDMPGIKRAKADCSDAKDLLFGFVESEALAPIEAIVVQGRCAVVIYHLIIPRISPVPIPFGFVTEEPAKIERISNVINSTLEEYVAGNRQRFLGAINQNKVK
ncbi:hypothetical protein DFO61_2915 [Ectopseudomonas oleovorans]|uniref:Uncharacterized protein n=1 Tax=Ectopseudomonas oleovorans TaxID=301 RepID=A0A397MKR6_ECTOL|nr:hypothetical protein [Pseudomonas oleovorans]RIA22241.1 hypothetical protein DFO61_2915 [Pseudomonas oleovorans]